jgi:uncharacterized protein (UPF0261 family)
MPRGTGGRILEMLIENGFFSGALDMTTTEWVDGICGGALSAGPKQMEPVGRYG